MKNGWTPKVAFPARISKKLFYIALFEFSDRSEMSGSEGCPGGEFGSMKFECRWDVVGTSESWGRGGVSGEVSRGPGILWTRLRRLPESFQRKNRW